MRYLSFTDPSGVERAGVLSADGRVRAVGDTPRAAGDPSPMRAAIMAAGSPGIEADGPEFALDDIAWLPAIPDPSKVVAAPVNYRDHQAEMSQDAHIDALGVFLKAPSSVLAHGGVVRLPYDDRRFDQEGEFAAVIGRTASHVSAADALDHVFGYTSLLDMTMRGGEDRSTRKSFDTFTPVGPTIVTRDEVEDIDALELSLWVNGTLRQRADLADLIWGLPELISYASSVMTLLPGDVVTTGTPAGVGQVFDGDRIELEITGLDRLAVSVSAVGAVPCPTRGANLGPRPPETLTPVFPR